LASSSTAADSSSTTDAYNGDCSPLSQRYREKQNLLQEKYDHIQLSNDRLRNRLYHVKKEINHLKRLKRILCGRLLMCGDRFTESYLEIPDNESGSSAADKVIADVVSIANQSSAKRRRMAEQSKRALSIQSAEFRSIEDEAKRSISSIIDSVITESHEERMAQMNDIVQSNNDMTLTLSVMSGEQGPISTDDHSILQPSSIDHLLPQEPDS